MKFLIAVFLLIEGISSYASNGILGRVKNSQNDSILAADVSILQKGKLKYTVRGSANGTFVVENVPQGRYTMVIVCLGYATYTRELVISDKKFDVGTIRMQPISETLDEVKIVTQALAIVQKDDTVEYASASFQVQVNSDAAELVRKMPGIESNGRELRANGDVVLKVMVDGKPFFGDDPWATLKNLPAEVIQKVQVYNDRTEQERITGFREGPQSKTINIVTKPEKRNGLFGSMYAGGGTDNSNAEIYGSGGTLNRFAGDRRLTLTSQANNNNVQNFAEQAAASTGGSSGLTTTRAAGINYSDKWGKAEMNGSYFFNNSTNDVTRRLLRTYVLPGDAGQVYEEASPSHGKNVSHRMNMRVYYSPDTLNTILLVPSASITSGTSRSTRTGSTWADTLLNNTNSSNVGTRLGIVFAGSALYTHRFSKRGRTFSTGITASYNSNKGKTAQSAQNVFFTNKTLNNALNQLVEQDQTAQNTSVNVAWTEPVGKTGTLKAQYDMSYAPSKSVKMAYDSVAGGFIEVNSLLSGSFSSSNVAHKGGLSYQYRSKRYELSGGVSIQSSALNNDQQLPNAFKLHRTFTNFLPVATLQYRFSKTKNLQCNYNTRTSMPSVMQLQDVVNNADPLHLSSGNPSLRQPYTHSVGVRYNGSGVKTQRNFSAALSINYTQDYVAQSVTVAHSDTTIGAISLPAGAQFAMPVNIDGSMQANGNMGYSIPLLPIKCRLNINLSAGISRSPSIVNGAVNFQQNRNVGIGFSINSNISENVDFSLTSNTSAIRNANPVNMLLTSTYISEALKATVDLMLWKGIVVSSSAAYQANFGLFAQFNQNYILWNVALGKKLFKKRQGDLRISIYDLLNQNNNIQRMTTESYIQDMQTNTLQRYFMLSYSYKISSFSK
ncbi:MAG: outer membrane beta-barrel protein [Flavipsychrobacter sp.]|nr:outer membrane beta-barrel protein [Flavipsychrobacter sp.]